MGLLKRSLFGLYVVSFIATGCTDKSAERRANNAKAEAQRKSAEADRKQAELDAKLKEAEEQAAKNKKDAEELEAKINEFKSEEEARSLLLESLQKQVEAEQATLLVIQKQKEEFEAVLKAERERIDADMAKVGADKVELERRKNIILEQSKILAEQDRQVKELQAQLTAREAKFAQAVQETKEMFAKNMLGDALDQVHADAELPFLIHIIGYGSAENVELARRKVEEARSKKDIYREHKELTKYSSGRYAASRVTSIRVNDRYLITARAQDLKVKREELEAELSAKAASKKSTASQSSIWLTIRPVQKVQLGLSVKLIGSTSDSHVGRDQEVIAQFKNIASTKIDVLDIENLNLRKPGMLLFNSSEFASACDVVTAQCFSTLMKLKMLDKIHLISNGFSSYKMDTVAGHIRNFMQASIDQTLNDLKNRPLVGLSVGKFNRLQVDFDLKPIKDLFGVGRAPIIDDVQIEYTISALSKISTLGNDLDALKFYETGFIGRLSLIDAERAERGEIVIDLPIQNLQKADSKMQNLSLWDYKPVTKIPEVPARLQDLKVNIPQKRLLTMAEQNEYAVLKDKYEDAVEDAEEAILLEKDGVYEKRALTNAGALSLFQESLK